MHKYLFLDSGILHGFRLSNTKLEVEKLKKDETGPLFHEDYFSSPQRLWELRYDNGYPNVIYDSKEKLYRCYYTSFTYDKSSAQTPLHKRSASHYVPKESRIASLCYAQSEDGIHFEKPDLGLVEFEGSYHNNILMRYAHGTGVFLDKDELNEEKRYKLVTKVEFSAGCNYMATAFSGDGIHFTTPCEWPEFNPAGDTHNFPFRDEATGKFVVITRIWKNGLRICAKSESDDFISWSKPVEILRGSGFQNQIYSMSVFQFEGLYLGLASIYHIGDECNDDFDTVDVELKYTTSPDAWESVGPGQPIIERGKGIYPTGEFDCGCIFAGAPVEINNQLWVYYMGGNGRHTSFRETSLARGYFEKDRFAAYVGKDSNKPSLLTTTCFYQYGNDIYILADIAEGGLLTVALGTKGGTVYEGYEAENCIIEKQADLYYRLSFKNKEIADLHNKAISFHITFQNAKLYAIKGTLKVHQLKY